MGTFFPKHVLLNQKGKKLKTKASREVLWLFLYFCRNESLESLRAKTKTKQTKKIYLPVTSGDIQPQ